MGGQCSCYAPRKEEDIVVEDEAGDDEARVVGSQLITGTPRPESVPHIDEVYALDIRQEGILGHSSVGAVLKTRHRKSKTLYAVKQMNKKNIEMQKGVKEEVRALTSLDHPNICKVSETWEDAMSVYLIMDLCEGGNLTTLGNGPKGVNESSIAALVRQMVAAVSHLHARKMVHSDIKPENWLFATPCTGKQTPMDMSIKMIDFGLASKFGKRRGRASDPGIRRIAREEATHRALFCRSPEQVGAHISSEALSDNRLPEKMDVWAVGVIAYFLLSGQSPFQWASYTEDLVRRAKYTFMPQELWRPVSSEAKNFIAMCLQKDPLARPTSEKALALPWMRLAKAAAERGACMSGSPEPFPAPPSSQFELAFSDPPLETAEAIMSSFNSMHRLKALEKACVITAAHRIPSDKLHDLQQRLQTFDKKAEGVVTADKLFDSLHALGVPMADLMQMSKEVADTTSTIEYNDYVKTTDEFQRNMQDSVVWAIFRSFDGKGGGAERTQISKKELVERLKGDERQKAVREKFPGLGLESILDNFVEDGSGELDAEEFKQILREGFSDAGRH